MNQLEEDILYLHEIEDRISNMSNYIAGTYDTTEIEKEERAAIYSSSEKVRGLIFALKYLQKILNKKETRRWQ